MKNYLKSHTNSQFEIDNGLISYVGRDKTVSIPDGVEILPKSLFKCNTIIESVFIPKSVKNIISDSFFECCNLKSVYIEKGSNLETIDEYAFWGCTHLTFFEFGNAHNLKDLGQSAFSNCSLIDIDLSNTKLKKINPYVFFRNSMKTVKLPETLEIIDRASFSENQLEQVILPKNVQNVYNSAFMYNQITQLILSSNTTNILPTAFSVAFKNDSAVIDLPFYFSGEISFASFDKYFIDEIMRQHPFVVWKE